MSDALNELVELLALERVEEDLFRGQSQDLGWGTVFGGQVLGQATQPPDERLARWRGGLRIDRRQVQLQHALQRGCCGVSGVRGRARASVHASVV